MHPKEIISSRGGLKVSVSIGPMREQESDSVTNEKTAQMTSEKFLPMTV